MPIISENGVFHAHHLAEEESLASSSLALNRDHSLRGDNPRPVLGFPCVPFLGRAKHGVLGDVQRPLIAHGRRAAHDRVWGGVASENVVLLRILRQQGVTFKGPKVRWVV